MAEDQNFSMATDAEENSYMGKPNEKTVQRSLQMSYVHKGGGNNESSS